MKLLPIFFLVVVTPQLSAQFLHCSPAINIAPGGISITDESGGHLKFQYVETVSPFGGVIPDASNFVLLSRSGGTTPLSIGVYTNPLVVAQRKPGSGESLSVRFSTVDQTPASSVLCRIDMIVPTAPAPAIRSVVNSASLQPFLSPGALVSIQGSDLTGPTTSTTYGPTANYPTSVAGTSVTFNGSPAPLLYLNPGQINAVVPYAMVGQTSAEVKVQRFDQVSAAVTVQLRETSPGVFTSTQTGSGQGAILQQGPGGQSTYNSPDNPAARGAALALFATGMGVWTPPVESDIFIFGRTFTTQPVSVTIGWQPARVLYAGTTGMLGTWSVLQVNVVLPDGVNSGSQQVVLKIGSNDNTQQKVSLFVE